MDLEVNTMGVWQVGVGNSWADSWDWRLYMEQYNLLYN